MFRMHEIVILATLINLRLSVKLNSSIDNYAVCLALVTRVICMKNRAIIGIGIRRNYMITYLARVGNSSSMYYGKSVTNYIHNKWNNEGRY